MLRIRGSEKEACWELFLEKKEDGSIWLRAKKGHLDWCILSLKEGEPIRIGGGISEGPFPLDAEGYSKTQSEEDQSDIQGANIMEDAK